MNQSAKNRLVADDLDIVIDGGAVGHPVEQAGNMPDVADGLEFFPPIEFFNERYDVNWAGRFGDVHHAEINPAVRVDGEVFGFQVLGRIVVGMVVEQNCAKNGAFGLYVRGKNAYAVISRCHCLSQIPWIIVSLKKDHLVSIRHRGLAERFVQFCRLFHRYKSHWFSTSSAVRHGFPSVVRSWFRVPIAECALFPFPSADSLSTFGVRYFSRNLVLINTYCRTP